MLPNNNPQIYSKSKDYLEILDVNSFVTTLKSATN
jgi:hypothetical protein